MKKDLEKLLKIKDLYVHELQELLNLKKWTYQKIMNGEKIALSEKRRLKGVIDELLGR